MNLYHIQWGELNKKGKLYQFKIKKSIYVWADTLQSAKNWARNQEPFLAANVKQVHADLALSSPAIHI